MLNFNMMLDDVVVQGRKVVAALRSWLERQDLCPVQRAVNSASVRHPGPAPSTWASWVFIFLIQ